MGWFGYRNRIEVKLNAVLSNQEGIAIAMSALDDKITELQTETTAVVATVTALQGEVSSLQSQRAAALASNQAPTQAQLDALQSISDKLAAIASPAPTPNPAPVAG